MVRLQPMGVVQMQCERWSCLPYITLCIWCCWSGSGTPWGSWQLVAPQDGPCCSWSCICYRHTQLLSGSEDFIIHTESMDLRLRLRLHHGPSKARVQASLWVAGPCIAEAAYTQHKTGTSAAASQQFILDVLRQDCVHRTLVPVLYWEHSTSKPWGVSVSGIIKTLNGRAE